ncbi:MAG: recombinase family protein [Moraxellaceae bacterium]|nr:recombinase family protein [Moraxellaceae bacterium]MDZ4387359.1 recombinase family protein [Moraxellaceae bacterium]
MTDRIGYARFTSDDQNLNLQRELLGNAGCTKVYEEKQSGLTSEQTELSQCLQSLKHGDTLVVWRMDLIAKSLKDLVEFIQGLEDIGVYFESLTEGIETNGPNGELMIHVFSALSAFQHNLIRERTMVGLSAARARGRVGGRKEKLSEQDKELARELLKNPNIQVSEVAKKLGVSRQTIYRQVDVVRHTSLMNDTDC